MANSGCLFVMCSGPPGPSHTRRVALSARGTALSGLGVKAEQLGLRVFVLLPSGPGFWGLEGQVGPPCTQCLMFLLLDPANLHLLAYQGPVPPPGRALPGRLRDEPGSPWGPGDAAAPETVEWPSGPRLVGLHCWTRAPGVGRVGPQPASPLNPHFIVVPMFQTESSSAPSPPNLTPGIPGCPSL